MSTEQKARISEFPRRQNLLEPCNPGNFESQAAPLSSLKRKQTCTHVTANHDRECQIGSIHPGLNTCQYRSPIPSISRWIAAIITPKTAGETAPKDHKPIIENNLRKQKAIRHGTCSLYSTEAASGQSEIPTVRYLSSLRIEF
jgi:hypothetical protein